MKKSSGTLYWYGMGSDALDETDLTGNTYTSEHVYFAGKRIARRDASNNIFYYFADHLGTSRAIVQAGQTTACYDADFYPFGGERNYTNTCPQNYKFTSKERDSESGLDNFGARYDSSNLARFISPDPKQLGSHLSDPQSFNRYVYARNNPLLYVDPDGKDFQKALEDLKTFAKSTYLKVSIGIGYEAKVKVGKVEAKVGTAYKGTAEVSKDAMLKVSRSVEGGASFGPTNGLQFGESKAIEQRIMTINNDKSLTGAERPVVTTTDTIGGNTTVNSSSEQVGLGLEGPLLPGVPIVGGGEVGATREGISALGDVPSELKDSLKDPGPPPKPLTPPPPPCATDANQKCPK